MLDVQLPAQRTSFVGRETELETLDRALRDSRLLTIAGGAGLGKTRLAIALAGRQPGGAPVRFVGLSGLHDGTLVPHEVAARLAGGAGAAGGGVGVRGGGRRRGRPAPAPRPAGAASGPLSRSLFLFFL